jgi:hypothetical protein
VKCNVKCRVIKKGTISREILNVEDLAILMEEVNVDRR